MSREQRRRLDATEGVATDARDLGNQALSELAAHAAACTVRQEGIGRRLDGIEDQNKWQSRGIVVMLLMTLGAILLGVAEHKGLF